ncbi:MAG: 3'(2'),5'-bisphosphate nucleotidase CysQ [Planctomycetes bacterium]|nr:3'(2'),5'-bisphosphate nucleotidase CysQ [Planctomycetota bacterium]
MSEPARHAGGGASPDDADLDRRLRFACDVAGEAGRRLLALRASSRWSDETVLGDVADQMADAFLQGCLLGRWPDDGVLSEETKDDGARRTKRWCWVVDPLDGTKEYRAGRHDWAVHVGLACDGAPVLGAVAMPALGRVVGGVCVPGRERIVQLGSAAALADDVDGARPLRLAMSRSHTPPWMEGFARALVGSGASFELVPSGSVGFKVGLLLFGDADVYVHDKGLKEWDTLAPEAVARAAGWGVCRLDGSEQRYNQVDPRNDELVVCRPRIRERVLAAVAAHGPRATR